MDKKDKIEELELNQEGIDDEVIELVDEDGKTVQFYHVATIDYKEDWFVFFTPAEEMEEISEEEVVIFKLGVDGEGKDIFLPIEDEKLLQEVYDEYVKLMEEEQEDEGCGCGCGSDECGDDCEHTKECSDDCGHTKEKDLKN